MLTAEFKLEDALQVREEEGIEKGIEKGKFEVARRMLARKISVGEIVDITGLNEQDVLSLR
jgi:predicted transposase/invertase (TIGR01784 family)